MWLSRTHSELVVVAMALRHPREVYVPTDEQSARRHRRRDLPSEISTHPNDHVKLHATLRLVPEWSSAGGNKSGMGGGWLRAPEAQAGAGGRAGLANGLASPLGAPSRPHGTVRRALCGGGAGAELPSVGRAVAVLPYASIMSWQWAQSPISIMKPCAAFRGRKVAGAERLCARWRSIVVAPAKPGCRRI